MIHRDPTPWPTHLFLEGSVRCNCDCITCPSPVLHRPDLNPELAFSIIDQCAGKPIKEVHPFLYADPFVWPYLFDLMEYIQVVLPKTEIHLWTNGILLDEATAKTAIEVGLTNLAVSIDGASKETYSTIRRGSDYDLVVAHTLRFLEIAPKNIFVRVHMTVTESNRHEVNKFLAFWQPRLAGRGKPALTSTMDEANGWAACRPCITGHAPNIPASSRSTVCLCSAMARSYSAVWTTIIAPWSAISTIRPSRRCGTAQNWPASGSYTTRGESKR